MRIKSIAHFLELVDAGALLILDIDSTLVQTFARNQAILREYAHQIAPENPKLSQELKNVNCYPLEYGYFSALQRIAHAWTEEELQKVHTYWRKHFFSNEFLHCDVIHDGALQFVELLHKKNRPHVYLTGRPHPLMWEGTLTSLQKLGFPLRKEQLFLKPRPEDIDELYKSKKVSELSKGYEKVIFIDNEPKVLNQIDRDHPDISLIFVDTCHSPNVFPPAGAFKIKDFREIVKKLAL